MVLPVVVPPEGNYKMVPRNVNKPYYVYTTVEYSLQLIKVNG